MSAACAAGLKQVGVVAITTAAAAMKDLTLTICFILFLGAAARAAERR
jgi:hypothetical protein